jgi:ribosomal protein S18 acetylase RimI-like enzyme
VNVRRAERADINGIAELAKATYVDAFGQTFTPEELAEILQRTRSVEFYKDAFDKDGILVAEMEHQLIGYVQFGDVTFNFQGVTKEDQELQRVYVLSEQQGKGVGKALIEAALVDPRLKHAPNVYLDVWEKNVGAQRLYKSYGFEPVGRIDGDLVMVRRQPKFGSRFT